jgi:probable HAF family extracellular repeat protein
MTIDVPGARCPDDTSVTGINDCREVVGTSVDAGGDRHGFILSKGKDMTVDVPADLGSETAVFSVNVWARSSAGNQTPTGAITASPGCSPPERGVPAATRPVGHRSDTFASRPVGSAGLARGERTTGQAANRFSAPLLTAAVVWSRLRANYAGSRKVSVRAAHTPSLPGCRAPSAGAGSNGYNEGDPLAEMVCREDAASELAAIECAGRDPSQVHRAVLTSGHGGRPDPVMRRSDR